MTDNIQVGRTFYLVNIDRRDKVNDKEVFVSKVGKKYFYVSYGCQELKFDIKTRVHINTPYSPRYALYNSKQERESCGSFLEGWTINNTTGKYGYRTSTGEFLSPDKAKEKGY